MLTNKQVAEHFAALPPDGLATLIFYNCDLEHKSTEYIEVITEDYLVVVDEDEYDEEEDNDDILTPDDVGRLAVLMKW